MKNTSTFQVKPWHIWTAFALLCLGLAAVFIVPGVFVLTDVLAVPGASGTWSHIDNTKGPIQLSNDGAVTAFLSERSDLGDKVIIQGTGGNRIWDYAPAKTLDRIALSSNGKYVAAAGNGVHLLSIADKKLVWSWTTDGRDALAISPDGTWVAAGGYSGKVYLFNKNSSKPVQQWDLGFREDSPLDVAVSDDGKYVAATTNLAVYLFDASSTTYKWKVKPAEKVGHVVLSTDGRYLFGAAAHSVYLWDKRSSTVVWQKKWNGSLIGANINRSADKVVVSSQNGISVLNSRGVEVRHFPGDFGNSDVAMSQNGRYVYINDGSRRLYAFDDSYSQTELRPFRLISQINAGGHSKTILASGSGNLVTYPLQDNIQFQQSNPAVLALSPDIKVLMKDATVNLGMFVTNPSVTSQHMSAEVRLSLPATTAWWTSITGSMSDHDTASVKSKLLSYAMNNMPGTSLIHTEDMTVTPGSSKTVNFSATVPDLAGGSAFADRLASGMSNLSPMGIVSNLLGKIKGPLSKLIGNDAANLAVAATSRAISGAGGQMTYPMLGLGTVTLYDAQGKFYDEDTFYFMYLR